MKDNIFLILGGDNRSLYLGEYLEKQGLKTCYFAFNETDCFQNLNKAIDEADICILPLPVSRDRVTLNTPLFDETVLLTDVSALATPDKFIFGGQLPKSFCEELSSRGVNFCDYFLLEELAVYNAIPTAEGVVNLLIEKLPITVNKMRCGISGYGKVGKALGDLLKAMGAEVTVFARRETTLAEAFCKGLRGEHINSLGTSYHDLDVLINTVPSRVIDRNVLDMLSADCLLIETASAPFGIDFQAAKEKAMDVVKASSLPGKVAPRTAGEIIGRSILPIFKQRGFTE
ncbi:MAG: hypothetical protein IIX14_01445 [Clostridia bacterium]|nr:hypothetical protein [Clostridia bacterium]